MMAINMLRMRHPEPLGPPVISFVGSKTYTAAGASGSSTFSVSLTDLKDETGATVAPQAGDLVVINHVTGSGSDRGSANLLISGYTPIAPSDGSGRYANGTSVDTNQQVQWKEMGGTPDTTVNIPNSGSAQDAVAGTIFVFRNAVMATVPVPQGADYGASGTPNPLAITPLTEGSWIGVACGAAAGTGAAFNLPSDLSSVTNHFRSIPSADTFDAVAGMGIKTDWVSGSFDPAIWTGVTGSGISSTSVTFVLEPA